MSGELSTYELVGIMFILLLVIKMTKKEQLRFDLNKIFNDLSDSLTHWEEAVWDVINTIIDYENDTQDWDYDNYTVEFLSSDQLEDYIINRLHTFWPAQVAKDLEWIDSDDEYYRVDDVFWDVTTLCEWDIANWIWDILDDVWFPEEDTMLNDLTELLKHKVDKRWAQSMDELYYQWEIWENRHQWYEFSDGIHAIVEQIADENKWFMDEDDKSNGPDRKIHKNVLMVWGFLPAYVRDIFLKAFSHVPKIIIIFLYCFSRYLSLSLFSCSNNSNFISSKNDNSFNK